MDCTHTVRVPLTKSSEFMRWLILFLAILLFVLGVLITRAYFQDLSRARESLTWPMTEGIVTETRIAIEYWGPPGRASAHYFPYVKFEYRVNGREFWNSGGEFEQQTFLTRKEAEEAVQYVVGDTVSVYYMKRNPKISLLVRGGGAVSIVRPICALVLCLIGLFLLMMWKAMKGC